MSAVGDHVKALIADELKLDDEVPSDALLADLGADDLTFVDLILRLEEKFAIELSDEDAAKIVRVSDAIAYVERHAR